MTPSQNCMDLVKQFEGLRLEAYQDGGGVWTIGWGCTTGVYEGQVITEDGAEQILAKDLSDSAEFVSKVVSVPLTQGQFDALVDFTFNEGDGYFGTSTLLRELNKGNYVAAGAQLSLWVYSRNGEGKLVVEPGLVARRLAEHALFFS